MRKKQITVYKYDELDDRVKERVLNYFREFNNFDFLEDDLNEWLNQKLQENMILKDGILKLFYSLSYCQGDGLCFIGKVKFKDTVFLIEHKGRYYNNKITTIMPITFMNVYIEDINNKKTLKAIEKRTEEFKLLYYKICDELEKIGYDIIEAEDSEENIKEIIELNEYEFLPNGNII